MTTLLQVLLCGLVMVAPWLFGAVTARPQFFLATALFGIALLRFIQRLFKTEGARSAGIPTVIIPAVGLLLVGIWQLSPSGTQNPLSEITSATYSDLVPGIVASPELSGFANGLHTLSPEATRLMLAQMGLALLAFWLSFDLFEHASGRRMLYWALAINGLAIAGFGVAQQLSWNGMLFWTIPLRYGGSPFGPFVNRNNGAGYLLLTFSAAASCFIAAWFPFGLGQYVNRERSTRFHFSDWMQRTLGRLTPGVILSFLAIAAIGIGILASLSRAGAVGLVAATLFLIPVMSRWKTSMLIILVLMAGLSYAGLIWLGQNDRISNRLDTLKSLSKALEGRVEHWKDMEPLVRDFPRTGTGWGTYPAANQLYVSRNTDLWYQHAENQYLETMAEAGFVGLALFLSILGLIAYASARAIRTDYDGRQLASGLCGLLSVVAISVISLTDFSLSIGSIVLTLCVICGSVYASFTKLASVSLGILFAHQRPIWRGLANVTFLLAAGPALQHLHTLSEIEVIVDQIPLDRGSPTLDVSQCDTILTQLNTLSQRYPDQPGIFAASGELRIYRYRRMMYDELLKQPVKSRPGPRQLWNSTNLNGLDAALNLYRTNEESDKASLLLESREIQQNLPLALADTHRSLSLSPLQPSVSIQRAWLAHILADPSAPRARDLAMFVGASDSDTLLQLGQLSEHRGDVDENIRCWKRCLSVSDKWAEAIWDESTLSRDENETLALYPIRLQSLLAIANLPRDLSVRKEILSRIEQIVSTDLAMSPAIRARALVELGDLPRAADIYLAAIQETPYDIDLRIEASLILERVGRLEDAQKVVGMALALAPKRIDVKKRFEFLLTKERLETGRAPD